ncbi:cornifelin homolog [Xiphophorus maculatus]|uniref:cornifelin homolog n=1 Tax=Xiphophorus maculatus TaxID=8083 RepID=UPI000293A527|nr:cornifelin homolog [Xiphophorus maculatus]
MSSICLRDCATFEFGMVREYHTYTTSILSTRHQVIARLWITKIWTTVCRFFSEDLKSRFYHLMADQPLTDWDSGLCDCGEDAQACCYGFWCGPCLACTVSGRFGENRCLPLCDMCVDKMISPAALSLRVAMRHKYGIKGSLCEDIAVSCCCPTCVWCQMYRELKYRKKSPVVINMQVQPYVNMQPHPMMAVPAQPVFDR